MDKLNKFIKDKFMNAIDGKNILKKGKSIINLVFITFGITIVLIIGLVLAFIDIHVWSKNKCEYNLLNIKDMVSIKGKYYIPITIKH